MNAYFTNLTTEHKKLYAGVLRRQTRDTNPNDEEVIRQYAGDTRVEVIEETEDQLIVRSVDTSITVDTHIPLSPKGKFRIVWAPDQPS